MNKITEVTVTRLFGYEGNDYTVELLPDEPVTFIYGFNGIGKTTFLRLLDAALTRKFMVLDSILFESIQVKFDTDDVLTVRRTVVKKFEEITIGELAASSKDEKGFYFPIVYGWKKADGTELEGKYYFKEGWNDWLSKNAENTKMESGPAKAKEFYRKNQNPVKESPTPALQEIENDILRVHVELLHANKDYSRKPVALKRMNDDSSQINNIFENYEKLDTVVYSLEEAFKILTDRYKEIQTKGDVSSDELVSGIRDNYDSENKYVPYPIPDKIDYLIEKLGKYYKDYYEPMTLTLMAPRVLSTMEDVKKASLSFDQNFEKKCELFKIVINEKSMLTDKFIRIRQGKISVWVKYGGEPEREMNIRDLSSGEKNLLLLYFQLIFELPSSCQEGGMYLQLLDEPEVSMHPDWLIVFVDNLQYINEELGRGDNFQYVIATHSLAITYDSNEMMSQMGRSNE